jgi:hypothetical protein
MDSVLVQRELDKRLSRLALKLAFGKRFFKASEGSELSAERLKWDGRCITATPTTIRRLGLAIPGRLHLCRACVRFTSQQHYQGVLNFCQASFHHDAFLRALRA